MTQDQTQDSRPNSITQDAAELESKFGELAPTYAENRAEAAKLRGADSAAEHWLEVEEQVGNASGRPVGD
jgi:hypothetical protein